MPKYRVPITKEWTQYDLYIYEVEAANEEEALNMALDAWESGDDTWAEHSEGDFEPGDSWAEPSDIEELEEEDT